MAGCAWTLLVFLLVCFLKCSPSEDKIKSEPAEDVTLPCWEPREAPVKMLKWIRRDLESDGFVYFSRARKAHKEFQHPSFHGRAQLRDAKMKSGNFSIVLKNVTIADSGTYECHVGFGGRPVLVTTVTLTVSASGPTSGNIRDGGDKSSKNKDINPKAYVDVAAAVSVVAVFVLVVVGLWVFVKQNLYVPPVKDPGQEPQQATTTV